MECMTKVIHFDYSIFIFKSKKRAHIWPKVKAQALSSHFSSQLSRKHFKCNLKRILNIRFIILYQLYSVLFVSNIMAAIYVETTRLPRTFFSRLHDTVCE